MFILREMDGMVGFAIVLGMKNMDCVYCYPKKNRVLKNKIT